MIDMQNEFIDGALGTPEALAIVDNVKAAMPEVPIFVVPSCCAGVTPESHEAALKTMQMYQIQMKC